jgi:hypothetical protein
MPDTYSGRQHHEKVGRDAEQDRIEEKSKGICLAMDCESLARSLLNNRGTLTYRGDEAKRDWVL